MTVPSDLPWASIYPPSVDWAAELPSRPLPEILDKAAAEFPHNVFIDFLGKEYSYAQTVEAVAKTARGLQNLGVKKGDRIGLLLPNTPYYVFLYFAILKIGAVVVNFNPLYAEKEIEEQIKNSGVSIMATIDIASISEKLDRVASRAGVLKTIVCRLAAALPPLSSFLYRLFKFREISRLKRDGSHVSFEDLLDNSGEYSAPAISPVEDLAVLQYTGGTTGIPKGAMLTHSNLSANVEQARLLFPRMEKGRERMLGVLPFFHVFAMTAVMNMGIAMGGRLIILPRFDLKQVIETIHKKRPTLFPAVPTIYTAINNYKDLRKYDLSSIKYCISGGAPLPVEVKRDFERLTGCVLVEGYGLSETSPVATCNPTEGENRAGSIGLPLPGTYIDIISMEDGNSPVAQGQRGEVCIRGPQVMAGYWNHPEETASVLKDTAQGKRLHTGDVGYMDKDGYTFIVDRIKDMIAAGGFKVYPRHVEEAIYLHPAVEECIVAGVPDPYRGQTVKAYVKLRAGHDLDKDGLTEFLKDKLSTIEIPKLVEFRSALPKTAIGKLSKRMVLGEENKSPPQKTEG